MSFSSCGKRPSFAYLFSGSYIYLLSCSKLLKVAQSCSILFLFFSEHFRHSEFDRHIPIWVFLCLFLVAVLALKFTICLFGLNLIFEIKAWRAPPSVLPWAKTFCISSAIFKLFATWHERLQNRNKEIGQPVPGQHNSLSGDFLCHFLVFFGYGTRFLEKWIEHVLRNGPAFVRPSARLNLKWLIPKVIYRIDTCKLVSPTQQSLLRLGAQWPIQLVGAVLQIVGTLVHIRVKGEILVLEVENGGSYANQIAVDGLVARIVQCSAVQGLMKITDEVQNVSDVKGLIKFCGLTDSGWIENCSWPIQAIEPIHAAHRIRVLDPHAAWVDGLGRHVPRIEKVHPAVPHHQVVGP